MGISLNRYPGNPILRPNPLNAWEALNVFNAAAFYHNGLFHMHYRAQSIDYVSSIGYAVSQDGYHWLRLDQPVLRPGDEYERRGVEDPRLTELEGKYYLVYAAYSNRGIRVSLAESENLVSWKRVGIILPDEDNKDAALFSSRIKGRYCLLHRREPNIWLAYSDDLMHWDSHQSIMAPVPDSWEQKKVGIAGPPLWTEKGWLLIYHAVDKNNVYRLGAALLDREDPAKVIARLPQPILEPVEPWELKGDVPNVVFSCGQAVKDGVLYVFYGGADRVMGVATCSFAEMLAALS